MAVVYGLEKFHQYTYGRTVTVQSDHKPLEVIVKKELQKAPKRLQHMLLRIQIIWCEACLLRGKANGIGGYFEQSPWCAWRCNGV